MFHLINLIAHLEPVVVHFPMASLIMFWYPADSWVWYADTHTWLQMQLL